MNQPAMRPLFMQLCGATAIVRVKQMRLEPPLFDPWLGHFASDQALDVDFFEGRVPSLCIGSRARWEKRFRQISYGANPESGSGCCVHRPNGIPLSLALCEIELL